MPMKEKRKKEFGASFYSFLAVIFAGFLLLVFSDKVSSPAFQSVLFIAGVILFVGIPALYFLVIAYLFVSRFSR